jgi:hypothetical protein
MGIRRPTRVATAAATAACAAALTACGGNAATGTPPASGTATPGTPGTRAASTPATPPATGSPARLLTRAADATASAAFHTDLTTRSSGTAGATALHVTGAYAPGAHPSADLQRAGGDRAAPRELRLLDGVLYVRLGNVMRPGGGGKPWSRATVTTRSQNLRSTLSAVQRGLPAPLLRMAATAHDARTSPGPTMDGVRTTRVSGTFDAAAAAGRAAPADRWAVRDLRPFHTMRFDAWLGPDGRPRRLVLSASAGAESYTAAQTFTRYGVRVHVVAPPSRQVGDGDGPVLPRPRT